MEKGFERLIFASRWLQLPLYLGLILAQCVYVFHFWVELVDLIGAAFGFGWTPCAGPALAAILFVAAGMGEVWRGGALLLVYGLAMTLPFVVAAMFAGPFLAWVGRHRALMGRVEKVMGVMLILFAVLIATDSVNRIAALMVDNFDWSATTL